MRALGERVWFGLCLALGRLLRAARYSQVRAATGGAGEVEKRRLFYASPLLIAGNGLLRLLGAGVRVLSWRHWAAREQRLYAELYGARVGVAPGGTLVLPRLRGETLALCLEDPALSAAQRTRAIDVAAQALRRLHDRGLTHGDAMAENVMVDLDGGVARWFDFETVHDATLPEEWCRADDLRALLTTILVRARAEEFEATLDRVLQSYGDGAVLLRHAGCFRPMFRGALPLHLGQAPLSFRKYSAIRRRLEKSP